MEEQEKKEEESRRRKGKGGNNEEEWKSRWECGREDYKKITGKRTLTEARKEEDEEKVL